MPLEAEMDLRATTSIGVAGVRSPICARRANRRGPRRQRARPAGAVALARVAIVRPDFGARASPIRVDETRLSGRARPVGKLVDPSTRAVPWWGKVATRGPRFTRRIDGGRRGRAGGDEQCRAHERHGEAEALHFDLPGLEAGSPEKPRPSLIRRVLFCVPSRLMTSFFYVGWGPIATTKSWYAYGVGTIVRGRFDTTRRVALSRAVTTRSRCRSGSPHPHRAPSVVSSPRRP